VDHVGELAAPAGGRISIKGQRSMSDVKANHPSYNRMSLALAAFRNLAKRAAESRGVAKLRRFRPESVRADIHSMVGKNLACDGGIRRALVE
jgi:hypothetical protein